MRYDGVTLLGGEIVNAKIEQVSAFPTTEVVAGRIVYLTTAVNNNQPGLYVANMQSVWTAVGSGAAAAIAQGDGIIITTANNISTISIDPDYVPPGGTKSINNILPDSLGNVTLAAGDVGALALAGGIMTGDIDANGHTVKNLADPVNDGDAVGLAFLKALTIDGGTIGGDNSDKNVVKLKSVNTAGYVPTASDLASGEVVINYVDKKMYVKNASNVVVQIGVSTSDISQVGLTGNYNDLLNKPSTTGQLVFVDFWDASTNTPAIPAASSANQQKYYLVKTAGTTTIDGNSTWAVGDYIVSDGTKWVRLAIGAPVDTTQLIAVSINADPAITKDVTYVFSRQTVFGNAFVGSTAYFTMLSGGTNAVVNIKKNGTTVGTLTYNNGSLTFASTGNSTTFAIGDRLTYNFTTTNVQAASITLKGNWS